MIENIAFVFPGQASQEVGMGKALTKNFPAARGVFENADEILGFSLSKLCFDGPEAELNDTINTQVAVFVTSIAALELLRSAGFSVRPTYVAGHSLGEFSAYVAAGVLSFDDGLQLVRERGRLMKQAGDVNPGGMAAILRLSDEVVTEVCRIVSGDGLGTLQVANFNSPGQVVISGTNAAVERGIELALENKARKAIKLAVSIAAHSELMRGIAHQFREAVDNTPLNLPEMPIVANITAEPLHSLEAIREEMVGQLTASVRWTDSIRWMVDHGITDFIEIGPNKVLTGLIRRISKQVNTHTVGIPVDVETLLNLGAL